MTRVLVTGGSGFIGRNLVESLRHDYMVSAPSSAELDLLDTAAVREYLSAHRFDVVIHAAMTRVDRRFATPADFLDRNCRMFFNLVRDEGLFGKMLHLGSGAEYERSGLPPQVREDYFDTRIPTEAYGLFKYICAKYILKAERIVNLRLFGIFGKYEDYLRFISNACVSVVKGRPIVIQQNAVFDYLYIDDLAAIVRWFIDSTPAKKAYNVCSGRRVALLELAQIVARVSCKSPEIHLRKRDMAPEYTGDNSLLMAELGACKFCDWHDAIFELYSWYAARESTISVDQLCVGSPQIT